MARTRSNPSIAHEHALTGEKLSLLAIFAHPEDESFGPAGTLAKYASEGVAVTLVTATRANQHVELNELSQRLRDRVCSCRASGIRRACLFDYRRGELKQVAPQVIEERLVRLIRELQPQVIVTFGPQGLMGDSDNQILNAAALTAFWDASDSAKFPHHFEDGLRAWTPQKLYYCVLPQSIVDAWNVRELHAMPDKEITTQLDVSAYSEAIKNAMYCQRHDALDFMRGLGEHPEAEWHTEYYALIESRLPKKPRREKDLFAGLR